MKEGEEKHVSDFLGLSRPEFESLTASLFKKVRSEKLDWETFWKYVRARTGKEHDAAIFLATMIMVQTGSVYPDRSVV
jgi:hypothetical protein